MNRLLLIFLLAAGTDIAWSAIAAEPPSTFCNPLSIPDYPLGVRARGVTNGAPLDGDALWLAGHQEQFRELADPTAVWHEGKWYLYPSVDMAWVSPDCGATWEHHPLNIRDAGYAPTVVKHQGRFFLMASGSPLYASDSPLGPFVPLGGIQVPPVAGMPGFSDPMLFSDEDSRLFFYWGCTMSGGIWGVELDASHPTNALTRPVELIRFQPATQPWEALGDWNQDPTAGWVEGSWMLKRKGKYFLTYSAAGTQYRTYAMGCYTGSSPLCPFAPQKRNPIFRSIHGLVTGTAHGCIVAGPEDRLWTFYTIRACVVHGFERRLGMDRVELDANGELFVPPATSLPQWLPGKVPAGNSADTGWLPINGGQLTVASTTAPNLQARFAVDDDLRTWWQPAAGDAQPTLTSQFNAPATIHAVRLIWRDVGLDTHRGVHPGPFRYRVELETKKDQWTAILDRGQSTDDLLIDYRECTPTVGTRARLVITGWPKGITPGVAEFTVFGRTVREPYDTGEKLGPEARATASVADELRGLRRLMDTPLRDTSIDHGPDGTWYLTGTVEPFWAYNEGIRMWKSPDLTNWTALGFVWKYGESPWHKPYLEKRKPLWAPEVHFLKGTFWLTYSMPGWDGTARTSGCGLLKSTTGRAEGPYQDMHPSERLGDEIDASLFQDDDGSVYFLWHSGKIAKLKPDMSGLAEPYRWLRTTVPDPNPSHHSSLCEGIFGKDSFDHVGYEGMFLFKANGHYYLCCAEVFDGRYSCAVASSSNLFGPYGARYEAISHGGHNTFFKDEQGQWWSTFFGSDDTAPWRERPGVLLIEFDRDGRLLPSRVLAEKQR